MYKKPVTKIQFDFERFGFPINVWSTGRNNNYESSND